MGFTPDPLPYAADRATANADLRAGKYRVTPADIAYDPTAAVPGAEDRARATMQAAAGVQPTAPAPAPTSGFKPDAPAPAAPKQDAIGAANAAANAKPEKLPGVGDVIDMLRN